MNEANKTKAIKEYEKRISPLLANSVARTLIEPAEENSLIAHVLDIQDKYHTTLDIWRWKEGKLFEENEAALQKALGNTRTDWPPRTVLFTITSIEENRAVVMVAEHYKSGLLPYSRGGQNQRWEFVKSSKGWQAEKKEILMIWD